MTNLIDKLIARSWNRLAAPASRDHNDGTRLDLGFQVSDAEVKRSRAYLPDSKRCEHAAILGKTGQGKSFLLRHLSTQDIYQKRGCVFFDLHGDTTPFLLRVVAAEERRTGASPVRPVPVGRYRPCEQRERSPVTIGSRSRPVTVQPCPSPRLPHRPAA